MLFPVVKYAHKRNWSKNYLQKNITLPSNLLYYITSGRCKITIGTTTYTLCAGDIFLLNANCQYTIYTIDELEFVAVSFDCNLANVVLDNGLYQVHNPKIFELIFDIVKNHFEKPFLYADICNIRLTEALCLISTEYNQKSGQQAIKELLETIESSDIVNINVEEMALRTGYSYDHFRHKFKSITGISPKTYILDKRINYACSLIRGGEHSYTEVAMICGFSSSTQFSVQFKNKVGITPKEYFKKYLKQNKK